MAGRVVGKGLADELRERGYLVLDGIDGRAHYIALPAGTGLEKFPTGAVVEARGAAAGRTMDNTIAGLAEGLWRVSPDLSERTRQYEAQRQVCGSVTVQSRVPIEKQARAMGATWLDEQLIRGAVGVADQGFGGELREALRQRSDFLIEQGLAERRSTRVALARNLLGTLCQRDLDAAAKVITGETGLLYRPASHSESVPGVYRRSVLLTSGRFAMLDDGHSFSLVPWKPVKEQRFGQRMTTTARASDVTWDFGRNRSLSI